MLIEHLIQRDGGTPVEFVGKTYWFMPDDQGRHVAEVDDINHQRMLLAITDYRPVLAQTELPLTSAPMVPARKGRTQRFTPAMPDA